MVMDKTRDCFLDECQELMDNDIDWVHINCGGEGSGKTTYAILLCLIANPNFGIDDITLGYQEFTRRLDTAQQGAAILCDEGGDVFLSREAMGKPRADSLKQMMKIRAKNLFVVINISDISLLESYMKNFRLKSLSRTRMYYRNGKYHKGYVELYTKRPTKHIHKDAKGEVKFPKPSGIDTFDRIPPDNPLWVAYKQKSDIYKKVLETDRMKKAKEHPIIKYFGKYNECIKSEIVKRMENNYSNPYMIIRDALKYGIISEVARQKVKYLKLLK